MEINILPKDISAVGDPVHSPTYPLDHNTSIFDKFGALQSYIPSNML